MSKLKWRVTLATQAFLVCIMIAGCGEESPLPAVQTQAALSALIEEAPRRQLADCYVEARRIATIAATMPSDAFGELSKPDEGTDWLADYTAGLADTYQLARATELAVETLARSGGGAVSDSDITTCQSKVDSAWALLDGTLAEALTRYQSNPLTEVETQLLLLPLIDRTLGTTALEYDPGVSNQFGAVPSAEVLWDGQEVAIIARVDHVVDQLV